MQLHPSSVLTSLCCQTIRKRRNLTPTTEPTSDLELVASLLPSPSATQPPPDEEDAETEDILRDAALVLFRLTYTQAQTQLESLDQELELLRSMPPAPPSAPDARARTAAAPDDMWRLDAPARGGGPDGKGPLLDPAGKVRQAHCCMWMCRRLMSRTSRCGRSRSCRPARQTVRDCKRRCSSPTTDCRRCPSTSTSRSSSSGATSSPAAGTSPTFPHASCV